MREREDVDVDVERREYRRQLGLCPDCGADRERCAANARDAQQEAARRATERGDLGAE